MKIVIYSSSICPYCVAAKDIFSKLNYNYKEILIDNNPEVKRQMIRISNGRTTVPQIFIGPKHVGGYDDLKKILDSGKLIKMLDKQNEN